MIVDVVTNHRLGLFDLLIEIINMLLQTLQTPHPPKHRMKDDFLLQTRISISDSTLRTRACNWRISGAGGFHAPGCCERQKRAINSASTLSFLVRDNPAKALALTAAGLTTLTIASVCARKSASASPYVPVASRQA